MLFRFIIGPISDVKKKRTENNPAVLLRSHISVFPCMDGCTFFKYYCPSSLQPPKNSYLLLQWQRYEYHVCNRVTPALFVLFLLFIPTFVLFAECTLLSSFSVFYISSSGYPSSLFMLHFTFSLMESLHPFSSVVASLTLPTTHLSN